MTVGDFWCLMISGNVWKQALYAYESVEPEKTSHWPLAFSFLNFNFNLNFN